MALTRTVECRNKRMGSLSSQKGLVGSTLS